MWLGEMHLSCFIVEKSRDTQVFNKSLIIKPGGFFKSYLAVDSFILVCGLVCVFFFFLETSNRLS